MNTIFSKNIYEKPFVDLQAPSFAQRVSDLQSLVDIHKFSKQSTSLPSSEKQNLR